MPMIYLHVIDLLCCFLLKQIIDSVASGLHDNTKLLVVDHIPSNTPFIMPIKEIVDKCHAR